MNWQSRAQQRFETSRPPTMFRVGLMSMSRPLFRKVHSNGLNTPPLNSLSGSNDRPTSTPQWAFSKVHLYAWKKPCCEFPVELCGPSVVPHTSIPGHMLWQALENSVHVASTFAPRSITILP